MFLCLIQGILLAQVPGFPVTYPCLFFGALLQGVKPAVVHTFIVTHNVYWGHIFHVILHLRRIISNGVLGLGFKVGYKKDFYLGSTGSNVGSLEGYC